MPADENSQQERHTTDCSELREVAEELFRIVQRERLLPWAREKQVADLLARWREH